MAIRGELITETHAAVQHFDNDYEYYGTGKDVAHGYDQSDANANLLKTDFLAGGAAHVPVHVYGVDIADRDLTFFNGVTEPVVAVVDLARTSWISIGFQAAGQPAIQIGGVGTTLYLPNIQATEVTIYSAENLFYLTESDQTDPAGRYRFRLDGDILYLEDATTASWAADNDLQTWAAGSIVINAAGADINFQVKGNANDNMIVVDAGLDTMGLGAGVQTDTRLYIGFGTLTVTADANGEFVDINPALTEAGSGTHAIMAGVNIQALTLTAGVGATTVAVTLRVANAPSGGGSNYAFWVAAGQTELDGAVVVGTTNGIDYTPGSDADVDLITITVTGTPILSWDESDDRFTFSLGVDVDSTVGYDVTPGSDTDADLITVNVTGTPRLWWDESEDCFVLTKGLILAAGTAGSATEVYLVNDNTGDLTLNALASKTINLAIAGADTITIAAAAPAGTVVYILNDNSGDFTVNALSGKQFNVAIAGADEYTFSATILDMNDNALDNCGYIILNAATSPAATEAHLTNIASNVMLNVITGNQINLAVANTSVMRVYSDRVFFFQDIFTDRWQWMPTNTLIGSGVANGGGLTAAGTHNTGYGYVAFTGITSASFTTAVGSRVLVSLTSGDANTAIGYYTLRLVSTGAGNTALGHQAGDNITTGSYNTVIGYDVDAPSATANYQIEIGDGVNQGRLRSDNAGDWTIYAPSGKVIKFQPDGDTDDYVTLDTLSGIPTWYATGSYMRFGDAATTQVSLASEDDVMVSGKLEVYGLTYHTGVVYIGDANATAEAVVGITTGIQIDQGAADNAAIILKSSDVAHGMTTVADTDTYGVFKKVSADAGGLNIIGLTDADGSAGYAIALYARLGEDADTTKSTTGIGITHIISQVKSGTTVGTVNAEGNIFVVANHTATRLILDAEGDLWLNGGITYGSASDFIILANTIAALEFSDGTTKLLTFDTRNTVTVENVKFISPASQTLPNGATSRMRAISQADFTVTLAGTTQVTTLNQGMSLCLGAPTINQSGGAVTVDQASTLHVPVITAGTSVTITANRMISTGVADCYLTGAGVWTDTASTIKVKRDVRELDLAATVPYLIDELHPKMFKYNGHFGGDFDRQRYGLIAEEFPDFLRVPGDLNESAINASILANFALVGVKYAKGEIDLLKERVAELEAELAEIRGGN